MEFRFLEPKDYQRVGEIFKEFNGTLPDPRTSTALIAEQGGKICGFFFLNFIPVLDSMWVDPQFRNTGLPDRLITKMISSFKCFFVGKTRREEKMAKKYGAVDTGWKVFRK